MKRRDFIIKSGVTITAAMLSQSFITKAAQAYSPTNEDSVYNRRPNPDMYSQPILKALSYAMNAPNPHNSQAWKFKILNDMEALFYVDETRLLVATDPPARQIHIGCGCFVALFKIASGKLGLNATIDYLPEGTYGLDLVGKKSVAKLKLSGTSTSVDPLFEQIFKRQTNRTPYKGDLITQSEFDSILNRTSPKGSAITLINTEEAMKPLLVLLYKGMEQELNDYTANDESRIWFRVKDDIAKKRDGINLRMNGVKGMQLWLSESIIAGYKKEAWHTPEAKDTYLRTHARAVFTAKGLVIWKTQTNTLQDWLFSGEDYARFQLAAFEKGFAIHPLSQSLQEYSSMKSIYDEFNLAMKVKGDEKIQMAARIGRASEATYSYRRNTEDLTSNIN